MAKKEKTPQEIAREVKAQARAAAKAAVEKQEAKIKKVKKKAKGKKKKERKLSPFSKVVQRHKSGVPGLDELLYGGFPEKSLVLLSGDPGSGKTIMCLQFLYEGATKYNEKGVFISLEAPKETLVKTADQFGWDFRKLIDKNMVKIETVELYDFEKLKNMVEDTVQSIGAKRVVIDPGVIFKLYFESKLDTRKKILDLAKMLKDMGAVVLMTNELNLVGGTVGGFEEYIADGVILLYHSPVYRSPVKDYFIRSICVLKMRGSKIVDRLWPLEISPKGLRALVGSHRQKMKVYTMPR